MYMKLRFIPIYAKRVCVSLLGLSIHLLLLKDEVFVIVNNRIKEG